MSLTSDKNGAHSSNADLAQKMPIGSQTLKRSALMSEEAVSKIKARIRDNSKETDALIKALKQETKNFNALIEMHFGSNSVFESFNKTMAQYVESDPAARDLYEMIFADTEPFKQQLVKVKAHNALEQQASADQLSEKQDNHVKTDKAVQVSRSRVRRGGFI